MDDQPKNGSGPAAPEPLTDGQKLYADRFRDWMLTLSREDFAIAVERVLQPLKAAHHNHVYGEADNVPRPS